MKCFINTIAFFTLLGMTFQSSAQSLSRSVIGSAGSTNPQLSYTVGETVIETGASGLFILTQGFQQPDMQTVSNDPLLGETNLRVYPNPTQQMLTLEIEAEKSRSFEVEFVDIRGRRVISPRQLPLGTSVKEDFDVSGFASGTYVLILKSDNGQILESIRFRKTD